MSKQNSIIDRTIFFVFSIVFLVLLCSIVIEQSWIWIHTQIYSWTITTILIAISIILFILIPLAFIRRTRIAALIGLMISFFIIQISLYPWGFDLVYNIYFNALIGNNNYNYGFLRGMFFIKYSFFFFGLYFLRVIIDEDLFIIRILFIIGAVFIAICFIIALIKSMWLQAGMVFIFVFLLLGTAILNNIVYEPYRNDND